MPESNPTYHFECSCAKFSSSLGEQYMRLRPGTLWLCAKCTKEAVQAQTMTVIIGDVGGGAICKPTDF